jgi:hypothetical protein
LGRGVPNDSRNPKNRIGLLGNVMPSNFVNLDAIIRREDWQTTPDSGNSAPLSRPLTFKASEFETAGTAFQILRKPEFQRETASWEPEKVVDLVKSFLEDELIPAVIIWKNNQTGNLFVIDGAHRLGALIAWVHNDYGDGALSRDFFKNVIPPEQQKAADKTRDLMKAVGFYEHIKASGKLPITEKEGRYARVLLERSIDVQNITGGGFEKAQASFFKINQQAAVITATELQLIKSRNKAYGIATRALVRSGVGHKFWKQFSPNVQSEIESVAEEVYSLIFKPPLTSPISVGLDLPVGGRGYSTEAISLLLGFVNLAIEPPKKRSRTRQKKTTDKPQEPPDDLDGKITIKILNDVRNITTRMTGKTLRSLALHSAIYFYSATGRFQPTAFIAIASLIRELDLEDGKPFVWFTLHRQHFEKFLASHRYLVNQVVIKNGSMEKSHEPMLDMFRTILALSGGRESDEQIMEKLKTKFYYLRAEDRGDYVSSPGEFSPAIKNARLRKGGLAKLHNCAICKAPIHPNAISMGHEIDKSDGGAADVQNVEFEHPFCNSSKAELLAIFNNQDAQAWRSVPTPKCLCLPI